MTIPTYYSIRFHSYDAHYDCTEYAGDVDYDTEAEARKAWNELIEEDEKYGVDEYEDMELLKCGNGEEPESLDYYEFEGSGNFDEEI